MLRLSAAAAAASLLRHERIAQPAGQEEAAGLGAEDAAAPTKGSGDEKFARFILREADDSPLADERMRLLHARDLANDPLPQTIVDAEGRARVALAKEPMQVVCRLKVPGFGEVYCYADNDGKGYTREGNVDFVADAAATRLRRVREAAAEAKRARRAERSRAGAASRQPRPGRSRRSRARRARRRRTSRWRTGCTRASAFALNAARHRIAKLREPRKDFGFGAMISGYDALGPGVRTSSSSGRSTRRRSAGTPGAPRSRRRGGSTTTGWSGRSSGA